MKLSTKLFLGISGVMAAALLIFGYFILSVDFKKNLDYQIDKLTVKGARYADRIAERMDKISLLF